MKNAAFDEFVKSEQEPAHSKINWVKERDEWLKRLEELNHRIRGYLEEYISSGQIQFEAHPVELTEENIGRYKVEQITLKIGRKQVRFQPVGTLLIGSKGRVDV